MAWLGLLRDTSRRTDPVCACPVAVRASAARRRAHADPGPMRNCAFDASMNENAEHRVQNVYIYLMFGGAIINKGRSALPVGVMIT